MLKLFAALGSLNGGAGHLWNRFDSDLLSPDSKSQIHFGISPPIEVISLQCFLPFKSFYNSMILWLIRHVAILESMAILDDRHAVFAAHDALTLPLAAWCDLMWDREPLEPWQVAGAPTSMNARQYFRESHQVWNRNTISCASLFSGSLFHDSHRIFAVHSVKKTCVWPKNRQLGSSCLNIQSAVWKRPKVFPRSFASVPMSLAPLQCLGAKGIWAEKVSTSWGQGPSCQRPVCCRSAETQDMLWGHLISLDLIYIYIYTYIMSFI